VYVILWEFEPKPEAVRAFERAYGPNGDWAGFFGTGAGYRGTELLRDLEKPGRYITIDRWDSRSAYLTFVAGAAAEYDAIDKRCEALTARETLIGRFDAAL